MKVITLRNFEEVNTDVEVTQSYEKKMIQMGENQAFIVHEMAGLIAVLAGRVSLARTKMKGDSACMESLESIEQISNKCINFLTTLRKINSFKIELGEVDLAAAVENFLTIFKKNFSNYGDITLIDEVDCNLPPIKGEDSMVFMLIQTVIFNSLRAMEDRSTKILSISTKVDEDGVNLIIKDSGSGMDSEILERIINGDAPEEIKGTGQGIRMIKQWSNYLGIECKIRNIPNVGVHWLFKFRFFDSDKEESKKSA